jgi:hypothetical protein
MQEVRAVLDLLIAIYQEIKDWAEVLGLGQLVLVYLVYTIQKRKSEPRTHGDRTDASVE